MNSNSKRPASPAERMINVIIAVVIIAVLALAVYAVYGVISENLETKAITEGTKEATIRYQAEQSSMSVEDYLAQYSLENAGLKGSDPVSEMYNKMTVENFAKFSGTDVDSFLSENGLKDIVTKDDLWGDAQLKMPLGKYIGGDDYIDSFKEFYGLDASVTKDTPWGDVKDAVEAKQEELKNATPAPAASAAPAASTAPEASAAPAETAKAE